MRNYLEHEEEVTFVDGILAKSQDWQWFVDYVEDNFELDDIQTYSDFQNKNSPLRKILGNFIKILEVCDKEWTFKTPMLNDLFYIAKYSIGAIDNDECQVSVSSYMGKILLLAVWLTKLENADNKTDYIIDMRFLGQRNFYQAINMQSFTTEEDYIIEYLDKIEVDGFDEAKKCIVDNINCVSYGITEGFFEKYKDNLLSSNAFNYQYIQKDEYLTWQEQTLLDMLSVSIKRKTISPTYSIGNTIVPDYTIWTSALLQQIKEYFNNPISDFVIESIDYVKNEVLPDIEVIDMHCKMLKELIDAGDEFEVYSSSTYTILSSLFADGTMKKIEKTGNILELIKRIHQVDSMTLLLRLREDCFPVSKDQNNAIKTYITEQYKKISDIDVIHSLKDFLSDYEIAKHITQQYYDMIMPKFYSFLNEPRQQLIPMLFYQAMLFLIELNQSNQLVDKRKVKLDMIQLQEYWQDHVYTDQCKNLQEFKYSTTVASKDVDMFNNIILANPILIAQKCLIADVDDMVEVMNSMSEHAIAYMFKKMILSPIYPLEGGKINFDNHDIDTLLKTQVEELKEKYGYKFLNILDTDVYVSGIHERYREYAAITIPMFKEDEKLYYIIEDALNCKLIPYDENIQLGHLTQLFPLLEIQIRKLGKVFGIVPFKEKATEFMKFKDPSSVLRELLEEVYSELGSFENVPDLLFVYHFMYNGNSLNIRNECVHGRDYINGGQLKYAFKVTELALYMILYRNKVIEENMKTK